MTVAGLRSNLIPPFALADEVLVNRDGTTGRQTVDKFALQLLSSTAIGSLSDARQLYPTRADLPAASGQALRFSAVVFDDPDGNNNGTWSVQLDNMGAKAWLWAYPLQFSVIRGADLGEGTANAIEVSTSVPVADGILTSFRPFRDSGAGSVTVSFNGDEPLTVRDAGGSSLVAAGAITAGVTISGFCSGEFFDLISDLDSAANAASASASALLAQQTASGFLTTLNAALTASVDAATLSAGGSATAAGNSALKAEKWASEAVDVPVEAGKFSARHWAQKAEDTVTSGLANGSVTEVKLAAALATKINGKADKAISVTGAGLATGGGDMSANRVITVTKATDAEAAARSRDDVAVSPKGAGLAAAAMAIEEGILRESFNAVTVWSRNNLSAFRDIEVKAEIIPTASNSIVQFQVSTDNGATWLATGYQTMRSGASSGGAFSTVGNLTGIAICGLNAIRFSGPFGGASCLFRLTRFNSATEFKEGLNLSGGIIDISGSSGRLVEHNHFELQTNSPFNAIRMLASTPVKGSVFMKGIRG